MGVSKYVNAATYPKQGGFLGKDIKVMFNYNSDECFSGICVRDDMSEPFTTLITLLDGRVVNATECQYSPTDKDPNGWVKWDGPEISPLESGTLVDIVYMDGTVDYDRDSDEVASLFGIFCERITLDYATQDDSISYYRTTT